MTLAALAARLGHAFRDPGLLERALTHRSAAGRSGLASNERLEFLGDRVLGLLIAEWLVERFPAGTRRGARAAVVGAGIGAHPGRNRRFPRPW